MSEQTSTLVPPVSTRLTFANRWDHFLARWGWKRMHHRVLPGLYAVGQPGEKSPVFVTANYTLSFDALRSALADLDGYILVLDTKGVNVWCAAGEGTFGTDELVNRIAVTNLKDIVSHRVLILPQLGAPGIVAHEVKRRSGFRVEYGPVRAADVPAYLQNHEADALMRRVSFTLGERIVLIPIELVHTLVPMFLAAFIAYLIAGWPAAWGMAAAVLAGTVLFPLLLPWIPTSEFSSKGLLLGVVVALPFAAALFNAQPGALWLRIPGGLSLLLAMPAITAFLALNFTGATPFTSRTGVKHEIFTYIPWMAWLFGAGVVLGIVFGIIRHTGG